MANTSPEPGQIINEGEIFGFGVEETGTNPNPSTQHFVLTGRKSEKGKMMEMVKKLT